MVFASKGEFNLLYFERDVVDGFANLSDYSFSWDNNISAWYQNFIDGIQDKVLKTSSAEYELLGLFNI